MHQRRLLKLLLEPSLSSGAAVISISVIILGYSGWLFISENRLFYDYLFSAYGLHTFVWTQVGSTPWHRSFLASPLAYYALVTAAAVAAGLIVYTVLQGITLLFHWTVLLVQEARDASLPRRTVFSEQLAKLGLRIVTLTGWGLYGAFFVSTMVPFAIVLAQSSIANLQAGQRMGWLECFLALLLMVLALHLHVVFARLALLKPRVFGGAAAIQEAEEAEELRRGQMVTQGYKDDSEY